jgi:hypothetical protein
MSSQALDKFGTNEVVFRDLINITNSVPAEQKESMMRLLVVSLAAFWEAFHEDLCRETLSRVSNPKDRFLIQGVVFQRRLARGGALAPGGPPGANTFGLDE